MADMKMKFEGSIVAVSVEGDPRVVFKAESPDLANPDIKHAEVIVLPVPRSYAQRLAAQLDWPSTLTVIIAAKE